MENETTQEVQPDIEQEVELTLEEETPTEVATETVDWQKQALKYKAIAQRYAKKFQGGSPAPKQELTEKKDDDIRLTVKSLQMAEAKRQFGYEHGLSPEETDAVYKLNPNPTKEILDDSFVKGGLAALRAKKRVAENTPSSTSRSASFKPAENTQEARQKALEEFTAKRFGK